MSGVTLTYFHKRGDQACHNFKSGPIAPGANLSNWDSLTRDEDLKSLGVRCVVIEYTQVSELPMDFRGKVTYSPYLNIRHKEDYKYSSGYPKASPMKAESIKPWVLGFSEQHAKTDSTPNISASNNNNTTSVKTPSSSDEQIQEVAMESRSSVPLILGITSLAIGGAVLGLVGGSWLADQGKEQNTDPLLLGSDGQIPAHFEDDSGFSGFFNRFLPWRKDKAVISESNWSANCGDEKLTEDRPDVFGNLMDDEADL